MPGYRYAYINKDTNEVQYSYLSYYPAAGDAKRACQSNSNHLNCVVTCD